MSPIIDVLIVDDDKDWNTRLKELVEEGFTTDTAYSLSEALERIQRRFYYGALIDLRLIEEPEGDESGLKVLEKLVKVNEGTRGLMLTAYGDVESVKVALRNGQALDYIQKQSLVSPDQRKKVQDQIHQTIVAAKVEYAKRYGSGMGQLTAGFTDPKSKSVWETDVIVSIGKGGGYQALAKFLDMLLEAVSPLIPYELGEPIKIDRTSATVEGRYWSKGLGESVLIKFGRTSDNETMMQSLAPEMVIRRVSHKPYSGFIAKAGLQFEDLPQRT